MAKAIGGANDDDGVEMSDINGVRGSGTVDKF
ncbi:unnamed protein product [Fusarium venenatum]|uniref:Uncharacterized protein n=1 Tax=Fusarium venenatum TaxID=56646 RepID=A0A2L2SSV9_9HYPO|nr:uncharacterized protein FVRRES_04720 [Fusarium venenatum]CEI60284.1 unnamed protein product [Fusarium venenatum]